LCRHNYHFVAVVTGANSVVLCRHNYHFVAVVTGWVVLIEGFHHFKVVN
jgi:hypothetical protein